MPSASSSCEQVRRWTGRTPSKIGSMMIPSTPRLRSLARISRSLARSYSDWFSTMWKPAPVGDLVAAPGDAGEDVGAGMEADQADVHRELAVLLDAERADTLLAARATLR